MTAAVAVRKTLVCVGAARGSGRCTESKHLLPPSFGSAAALLGRDVELWCYTHQRPRLTRRRHSRLEPLRLERNLLVQPRHRGLLQRAPKLLRQLVRVDDRLQKRPVAAQQVNTALQYENAEEPSGSTGARVLAAVQQGHELKAGGRAVSLAAVLQPTNARPHAHLARRPGQAQIAPSSFRS